MTNHTTEVPTLDRISVKYGQTVNSGNYEAKRYDFMIIRSKPADADTDEFVRSLWGEARQQVASQIAYDERIEELTYRSNETGLSLEELKGQLAMIEGDGRIMAHHKAKLVQVYRSRIKREEEEEKKQARIVAQEKEHIQEMIEYAKMILEEEPNEDETAFADAIKSESKRPEGSRQPRAWGCLVFALRRKLEKETIKTVAESQVSDWVTEEIVTALNMPF